MATSGSTNYTVNRERMKTLALRMSGELANGETASADQAADTNDLMNMMLKSMQADGLKLWLRKKATVFLKDSTVSYALSTNGTHATYSYTRTTVKVNAVASATSIDVTSTAGMTAGDYIGFILNDGTSFWTTINTVVDSDSITIISGLTSDADAGKYVYFFTNKIPRPLRVLQAFVRDSSGGDTSVEVISQKDYMDMSTKTSEGSVTQVHYDPQITSGILYVWPAPDDLTSTLELIVERPIDDMDASIDDFDVPQEWYEPILFGLAYRVGIHFHVNVKIIERLKAEAMEHLNRVMGFDVENTSIFFSPERR